MSAASVAQSSFESRGRAWLGYGLLLGVGAVLSIACRLFPADLPFFMPWEFSWPVFLVTALSLAWFFRGLRHVPERPARWRIACFVLGVVLDYAVLQTHIDFYSQHMFFVHRWAHFVLHHLGAFLIALGAAGPVVRAGMPDFLRPLVDSRPVQRTVDVMQHPAVAPALFVG